jgi:DNA-binding response OmpR family regulator
MEPTVLLVEDDDDLRRMLGTYLQSEKIRVLEARDAREASALVSTVSPDVIVLDVMLPGAIDGLELARRFRHHPNTASVPVIILSAVLFESDRDRAREVEAAVVLPKPFTPDELVRRLRALLPRSRPGTQTTTSAE